MSSLQDYLKPDHHGMAQNHTRFCRAFAEKHENIARAAAALHPSTVVCFGAGMLNDIPVEAFLAEGAEVNLVDWMDGVLEFGIVMNIRTGRDCVFCALDEAQASAYCGSFPKNSPVQGFAPPMTQLGPRRPDANPMNAEASHTCTIKM